VVLLVEQDLPDMLGDGEFAERFALTDPLAVIADRVGLVLEIGAQHLLGLGGDLDRLRHHRRHRAEIVDLARDGQRVAQLLGSVLLELVGDAHILRALEDLRVDDIGDDRLVLAGQILVEQFRQLLACDRRRLICHLSTLDS